MRVLVTGGAGFLGTHLCAALLDGGCEVVDPTSPEPRYCSAGTPESSYATASYEPSSGSGRFLPPATDTPVAPPATITTKEQQP